MGSVVLASRTEAPVPAQPKRRSGVQHVRFGGIPTPVAFIDCSQLLDPLSRILVGWPFTTVDRPRGRPILTISRRGDFYRLTSPAFAGEIREDTAVSAVCTLIVELVQAWLAHNSSFLCLHSAAVELNGRLVVFPAIRRAGKSTLAARLAGGGARIFADDLLPIAADPVRGVALGAALRLRLPLPARSGPTLRRFVRNHAGLSDGYYCYLDLPETLHAHHGEEAPLKAFVLLDPRRQGPTRIAPIGQGDLLKFLVQQNVAHFQPGGHILGRTEKVAAAAPAFLLTYGSLEEAATTLEQAFCGGYSQAPSDHVQPAAPPRLPLGPNAPSPGGGRRRRTTADVARFRRSPSIETRQIADEMFLVDAETDAIHALDPIGAAIWSLLAEPISPAEATKLLKQAFPDSPPRALARDVAAFFSALYASGLIKQSPPARTAEHPRPNSGWSGALPKL